MGKRRKSKSKNYGDEILDVVTTASKVGIAVGATTSIMSALNKKD